MGGLFGRSAPMPDTSKQEEVQEKQEARTKRQEAEEQRRLQSQISARRTGGYRSLLSPERENAMTGLTSKLGGGS